MLIVAFCALLQLTLVAAIETKVIGNGCVILNVVDKVQLLASVMVTV